MTNEQAIAREAAGYYELQLYDEALAFIDTLSPNVRALPAILRVQTACAFAVRNFDLTEITALKLGESPEPHASFAARMLHDLAAIYNLLGHPARARKLIGHAVKIRPEQRTAILEDQHLKGLL